MEQVKIDNFYRESPEGNYPEFVTLDRESCEDIRALLSEKLRLKASADNTTLVNLIDRLGKTYEELSCNDSNFNLNIVLSALDIDWPEYVFINWHRFDSIDKLKLCDLINYFDDIWYPEVDDIDIFDDTLTWVLSVTHYGHLKVLKIT